MGGRNYRSTEKKLGSSFQWYERWRIKKGTPNIKIEHEYALKYCTAGIKYAGKNMFLSIVLLAENIYDAT